MASLLNVSLTVCWSQCDVYHRTFTHRRKWIRD